MVKSQLDVTQKQVLADRPYDINWIRQLLEEQAAISAIPSKKNRREFHFRGKE
ncbi:hypothetical protein [Paenibacillus sp. J22TS3]|uniref:hypothetical protein n=1 Tax=Paenibacillus sp. J22TS3 TaxID=2807192 RepID=UPI001BD0754A|nr:hypothetical protein [Paenibacillus sp. J22TS3]